MLIAIGQDAQLTGGILLETVRTTSVVMFLVGVSAVLSAVFGVIGGIGPAIAAALMVALALGIGIQNFPEGAAVAVPLRREGMSRGKAWFYGQMSAVVEPFAAVVGCLAVLWMRPVLLP